MLEDKKAAEKQLTDEAERLKSTVLQDADELRLALSVSVADEAKRLDAATKSIRAHYFRTLSTMTRCRVSVSFSRPFSRWTWVNR